MITAAHWVELDGKAHIVKMDRYLDKAICGRPLTDSTMIFPGMDLEGCMDCICAYAHNHSEQRPNLFAHIEESEWLT